jgi:hypothetical protein
MKIKIELDIADIDLSDKFIKMANHKYIVEDNEDRFLELFEKTKTLLKLLIEKSILEDHRDTLLDSFKIHFEGYAKSTINIMAEKLELIERK